MTNPTPYTLTSPVLVSAALAALNAVLTNGLTWLETAYGQGQRLSKLNENGAAYNYPAVYVNGLNDGNYLNMFPDQHLVSTTGGFSWWDVQSPVTRTKYGGLIFTAGLTVWFDFKKVYPSPADWKAYDVWNVADDVLSVLSSAGNAQINDDTIEIIDRPEAIYTGLSHNDIERQYSLKPFGVFRINMEIHWNNYDC